MAKYLVIVESPAKVKTIKKFLGSNYEVMASQGHVRDLPKSQMGIDVDNDFEPKYITIRGKGEILAALRKEAKKADKVYLATDPDREGEAISWHLSKALKLEDKDIYRITFNEITKTAVKAAIKDARKIDMNLVDAQQARRALDRVVGYSISPVLWAKIKRGLSAGRVQSVALRIICDRENEIDAFIPEEYWTMDAVLDVEGDPDEAQVALLMVSPQSGAYFNATPGYLELDICEDKTVCNVDESGKPTTETHKETTLVGANRLAGIAAAVHAHGGKVVSNINCPLAWEVGNVEKVSDALTVGFDTYPSATLDVMFGRFAPVGKLPLTLPKGDEVLAVNADGVCISPNDVPGFAKDAYMPDSMKDENGKAYAYRDAAGNYYEMNFGLTF